MTTQPKTLRLADWLESSKLPYDPADVAEAATELRRLHEDNQELLQREERLTFECRRYRAQYEHAVKLLCGIHALMYPAPIKMPDGTARVFRPKDPDPHAVLQELSDRIRALPEEIAKVEAQQCQS